MLYFYMVLLARLMVQHYFARWRLSSSVGDCNTPRPACRQLQPRMPGDEVMPPTI